MSFLSPLFLLLLGVCLLSLRLPARRRWMMLLPASWFFYACHHVALLGLLLLVTLVSYACALRMACLEDGRRRRRVLAAGLGVCFGLLFVFKYLDFTVLGFCSLLRAVGVSCGFAGFGLLLPMGISFYVFQTASYLVDVYRGDVPAERHFGYYALFVSFFPQLVAGPIERSGDLLPALRSPRTPDAREVAEGLRDMVRGFAKKVMVADLLSGYVDAAYGAPQQAGGVALMLATVLFALQIYCDFSGYTDIARGCARLLGVRLTQNFCQPYRAVTIRDFWRRWHISLTRWFTDYVYIPLGGRYRGRARQCFNILVVFLASGLWHGADITFVIWGLLHGVYLVCETLLGGRADRLPRGLRRCLTLGLVCFAWIFFRAEGLGNALAVLRTIVGNPAPAQWLTGLGLTPAELPLLCGLMALVPLLDRLPALETGRERSGGVLVYFLLITALLVCRCLTLLQGASPAFIYFQF